MFVTPCHHYHENSSKWQKCQLIWLLTKKVMRALCVIMTMTSMMLNLLTKKSEDLLSSHISLFAFWRNKWKRSQSQFFLCFKCKNKFKTFKYQHQFLKILKNTYSMVTLIPDHQAKFSLFGGFYRNRISKLGPQKMSFILRNFPLLFDNFRNTQQADLFWVVIMWIFPTNHLFCR